MSKTSRVFLLIVLLSPVWVSLVFILFSDKKSAEPVQNKQVTNSVAIPKFSTSSEAESIRNREFPLAGGINDPAVAPDTSVELINRGDIPETYAVGTSLTTKLGVHVETKFYNLGDRVTADYGYTFTNPSPKTNGTYADVKITLENTTKNNIQATFENIRLIDQNGREYLPSNQNITCGLVTQPISNFSIINTLLSPRVPCIVGLLFEVSTSSVSFHIKFETAN